MSAPLVRRDRLPIPHLLLMGWLPSPVKKWVYRTFLGYRIGRGVRLGFGSVIIGRDVSIADHVEIGLLTMVMGRSIRIGRHSSIGTMSYLSCRRIEIGEDARIREQVSVAGPELPESRFTLGDRTVILQHTSINPTKPVEIGDDTGIGGHCLIFTHGSWLNVLDGYPVTYKPVKLGKSVWLPWRVFIMPGAEIGDGAVIGANSLVNGKIPPSSLAVGSPARVILRSPDFPRAIDAAKRKKLVEEIVSEFERMILDEAVTVSDEAPFRVFRSSGRAFRMLWLREDVQDLPPLQAGDTVLSEVSLGASEQSRLSDAGAHWLDLAGYTRSEDGSPLTEELALFLGRYGIRLPRAEPGPPLPANSR